MGGIGVQSYGQPFVGQPFGLGMTNPVPFGASGVPAWGINRPAW
jgi:hypothetical protein